MKKIIFLFGLAFTIFSCDQPKNEASTTVTNQDEKTIADVKTDYIFQATYSQNFSMGDPALVTRFQSLLKNLQDGKLDNLSNYFTEDIVWSLPNGKRLEGKENVINFLTDFWSSSTVENYSSAVHFAVKSNQGDNWVLVWDSQLVNNERIRYQEAVEFEGDKIEFINTFTKPVVSKN
tara:strand:+ start:75 stop:605 length:531 start_codon:yes stop_codon:yes gene_type:complete